METAQDLDERVIVADAGAASVGDRVHLVVGTDDGDCAYASGVVAPDGVHTSLLDAALARWIGRGSAARAVVDPPAACDGLPPVDGLVVPAGGWAIGLRHPASTLDRAGPFDVVPIGADGRWWHVLPTGDGVGALAFDHPDAPPTRFAIRIDGRMVGRAADPVAVARGGATIVGLAGEPTYVAAIPAGIADVVTEGANLIVIGRASGVVDGVMRVGTQDPEPLRIEVGAPLAASPGELVIPAGGTRRVVVDQAVVQLWIAAPELLAVERKGRRLILTGRVPGRTHLVLRDAAGGLVAVPVAIGG